jgi:hypothetical protein
MASGRPLPLEPEDFLVPAELDPGVEGAEAA